MGWKNTGEKEKEKERVLACLERNEPWSYSEGRGQPGQGRCKRLHENPKLRVTMRTQMMVGN